MNRVLGIALLAVTFSVLLGSSQDAFAATNTWTGSGGSPCSVTDWSNAANWDIGVPATSGADLVFPDLGCGSYTVDFPSGTAAFQNFNDVSITSPATLNIEGTFRILGTGTMTNDGTVILTGNGVANGVRLWILVGGILDNNNLVTVIGGSASSSGRVLLYGTMNNQGTMNFIGGTSVGTAQLFMSGAGSTLNNFETMTFTGGIGHSSANVANGGTIVNSGTMTAVGGGGTSSAEIRNNNVASSLTNTGTMSFTGGGGTSSGQFILSLGTFLNQGLVTVEKTTSAGLSGRIYAGGPNVQFTNDCSGVIVLGITPFLAPMDNPGNQIQNAGLITPLANVMNTAGGAVIDTSEGLCPVGGSILPIDASALLIAGFQSNAMWITPLLALAGIGLVIIKRKF